MTEKTVDYFYTLVSPWTYLGHAPFVAMARKAGVRIVHKPCDIGAVFAVSGRSEEHTSELQSLMRISYAVFCLKKKKHKTLHQYLTSNYPHKSMKQHIIVSH